jgi:RNA 3'-terminal phosphate cyclase (ATP)
MASVPRSLSPIHLHGATLEGGGQLVRIALGLSALTNKPINISSIRARRSGGGGLKAQHLTSVQWLGQASNAHITGAELKSKEITFVPNAIGSPTNSLYTGEVRIKQTTPGSVNLVLQAILPYLLFSGVRSPIHVQITGGTNVSNSPSCDYITQVLMPTLELIGIPHIDTRLHSRGWSQGTTSLGSVTYTITPLTSKLPSFQLVQRGEVIRVTATVIAPKDTERQFREELDVMFERRHSRFFICDKLSNDPDIEITFEDSHHEKRYYLLLVATTSTGMRLGRDWLYDRGVRPGKQEQVVSSIVKSVSDDLLAEIEHGGCVDEYLRDQLVVYQALAEGRSNVYGGERANGTVYPSLHAQTAQWVAKEILGVDFNKQGGCKGIGFHPPSEEREEEEEELTQGLKKLEVLNT